MNDKIYIIVLADKVTGMLFLVQSGKIVKKKIIEKDDVPQNVKHGENTWDQQDKIFRHIQEHLKRHLEKVVLETQQFVGNEKITGIIIGGHKTLFGKLKDEFNYPLSNKILGTFVTELKVDQGEIIKRILKKIENLESSYDEEKLQKALS